MRDLPGAAFPGFGVTGSNLVSNLDVRDFFRASVCHEDPGVAAEAAEKKLCGGACGGQTGPSRDAHLGSDQARRDGTSRGGEFGRFIGDGDDAPDASNDGGGTDE